MDFSFVIPCYNTRSIIFDIIRSIDEFLQDENATGEVLLVDDCSDIIENIQNARLPKNSCLKLRKYYLAQNYGQQIATLYGLHMSKGNSVFTIDDDGEHDLSYLREMKNMGLSRRLVIGSFAFDGQGLVRRLGTKLVGIFSRGRVNVPKGLRFSSYRLIEGTLARNASAHFSRNPVVSYELLRWTRSVSNLNVGQKKTGGRASNYDISALVAYFWRGMILDSHIQRFFIHFMTFLFFVLFLGFGSVNFIGFMVDGTAPPGFYTLSSLICLAAFINMSLLSYIMQLISKSNLTQMSVREIYLDFFEEV